MAAVSGDAHVEGPSNEELDDAWEHLEALQLDSASVVGYESGAASSSSSGGGGGAGGFGGGEHSVSGGSASGCSGSRPGVPRSQSGLRGRPVER